MKPFLIQTQQGKVVHDFAFHLEEAIRYHTWLYPFEEPIKAVYTAEPGCIPVGSLDYVFSYMEKEQGIDRAAILPINIPDELHTPAFLKRNVEVVAKNELQFEKPVFIKSATQYKSFQGIVQSLDHVPDDRYLMSEQVDIDSEWRAFVFDRKLHGLHNYAGDFTQMPDVSLIETMIAQYGQCPPAYTLDVGINAGGTFVIEVHPFVSCGLYGFRDYKILPYMFSTAYTYMVREAKKSSNS